MIERKKFNNILPQNITTSQLQIKPKVSKGDKKKAGPTYPEPTFYLFVANNIATLNLVLNYSFFP